MSATFFYIRAIAAVVSVQPDTMQADFVSFEDDAESAVGEALAESSGDPALKAMLDELKALGA